MQSIRFLYQIGRGPSSSHTMGPYKAATEFRAAHPEATRVKITVYNSLALTGEGHLTFQVLREAFAPLPVELEPKISTRHHPTELYFVAYNGESVSGKERFYSIGGGQIVSSGKTQEHIDLYPHKSFREIAAYCAEHKLDLWEYVQLIEGAEIKTFLQEIWQVMTAVVRRGLAASGYLPGTLHVARKARELYAGAAETGGPLAVPHQILASYAFAVSEENAAGGTVVTAPTCGACGVVPSVLYYMRYDQNYPEEKIIAALGVGGLIGNLIKHNATISGAVGGCQAEVGSACAMAAAAFAYLMGGGIDQIEYAAEIAIEHHLGLTCDPVHGLVQIPCIERNAVAATRAITAGYLAKSLAGTRKISLDTIIETMKQTGLDMHPRYKETATAGMAYFYQKSTEE